MYDKEQENNEIQDIRNLLEYAGKYRLLTKAEERRWIKLGQSQFRYVSLEGRKRMLRHNLRLVIKISRRFTGQNIPLADLVNEGCTGLLHAITKFDLTTPYKFSTYASIWIEQRIRRAIEKRSRIVKIPSNLLAQVIKLKKAYKKFVEEENRPPSSKEIAEILGIPVKKAEELGRLVYNHVSLDETIGEDDNLPLVNYVIDDSILPDDKVEQTADKEEAERLLSFLDEDDRDFMKLKFGFADKKQRNSKEMAALLRVSLKEVKDREVKIMALLKKHAEIERVNMDIYCDVVLTSIGDRTELMMTLKKQLGGTFLELSKKMDILPSKLKEKVSQHEAKYLIEVIERTGSVATVVISS